MKATVLSLVAALTLVVASSQAIAQTQDDQEACEGDVYDLCQDHIPDEDEIVACLRKKWSKVSKDCRRVIARHDRKARKEKRESAKQPTVPDPALGY